MRASDQFTALLDNSAVKRPQIVLVAIILLALIIDGLDVQVLALVAPVVIKEWGITKSLFGPALTAALVGMAAGSVFGGWLGDKIGRRPVLILSTLLFGVATLAAAAVHDVTWLALVRLLSGVGFGAALPNGMALATEWSPARMRTRIVTLLAIGVPLGGMVGAPLTLAVLPHFGWRGCFVVCGVFTLIVCLAMLRTTPESPSYLLARGQRTAAVKQVRRVLRAESFDMAPQSTAEGADKPARSAGILNAGNLRMNTGAWLSAFCVSCAAYAVAAWGPVLYTSNGLSLSEAIQASFCHNAAAIVAALSASALLNRFGSRFLLPWAMAAGIAFFLLIGWTLGLGAAAESEFARAAIMVFMGGLGAALGFCQATIYSLLSLGYAEESRATGVGAGVMFGRIGAIVMVFLGGRLLDLRGDGLVLLGVLSVALLLAIAGSFIADRHIPRRVSPAV